MSVNQTIKRYTKIISFLRRRPMSYTEIQDEMSLDPDAVEDKLLTSQRTLQRDILAIASIYEIEIESNPSTKQYYIKDDVEDIQSRRLRENYEIVNAIKMTKGLGEALHFEERRHLGTENLAGLIHAIQNLLMVECSYTKFWDGSITDRKLKPISLKEARHRWYLIAEDEKDGKIKNFALDRIRQLSITTTRFKPIEFNVNKEFKDSFGIINGTGEEPVEVILSFTPTEGRYVNSLPLHSSQKLIVENEREMQFSYFIRPTYDFRMEILSYGDQIKVLEPIQLQQEIKEQLKSSLKNY